MEPGAASVADLTSLDGFVLERVLSEDSRTKMTFLLGRFSGQEGWAVVMLERQHFSASSLPRWCTKSTGLDLTVQNDVYGKFVGKAEDPELNFINVNVIYPATEKHIAKYSRQDLEMVAETPDLYKAVILPYIEAQPPDRIQWVYNILDKKAEVDRLLFEDAASDVGFMLHPDLKWDQTDLQSLYCLATCHRRDLRSIRDLRVKHIPLLVNIKDKALAAIRSKYGVPAKQLRAYCHYQPSYYHFHVHIQDLKIDGGHGMAAGRAHLLDDIIDNLSSFGDNYYQHRTLHYVLGTNDPVYRLLKRSLGAK